MLASKWKHVTEASASSTAARFTRPDDQAQRLPDIRYQAAGYKSRDQQAYKIVSSFQHAYEVRIQGSIRRTQKTQRNQLPS